MPVVKVDIRKEHKESHSEPTEVEQAKTESQKPIKKDKAAKKSKPESGREDKIDSKLDKIHKKNDTVCFSKPINKFKFYALDCNSLRIGDHDTMIDRGCLVFDDFQSWYDLVIKHEKALIGFKPMKGADITYKYPKQWSSLCLKAKAKIRG